MKPLIMEELIGKVERDFLVGGVLHEFKVDTFIKQNLVTEF